MASTRNLHWDASPGLTNSNLSHDERGSLPNVSVMSNGTGLYSSFLDTPRKRAFADSRRYCPQSIADVQLDEWDEQMRLAAADHAARMARYQARERECRASLMSLEDRLHQLEQRRWDMEASALQAARHCHPGKASEALAQQRKEEAELVALWETKRSNLTASLRSMDAQMQQIESQQQWLERTLVEQRAAVAEAEDLTRSARAVVACVHQPVDDSTTSIRATADALRQEVAQLEADTDKRLESVKQATVKVNAELELTQSQLMHARNELADAQRRCASEQQTLSTLVAQREDVQSQMVEYQSELERATSRLDAITAESTARERRAAQRCASLEAEEARLTQEITHLKAEYAEQRDAVERLRVEVSHAQAQVSQHTQYLARVSSCGQEEDALALREHALDARRTQLQASEEAVQEREQQLCASITHLDDQARHAVSLAAATEVDLLRGIVGSTRAVCASSDLLSLAEQSQAHMVALIGICEDALSMKVDVFLDSTDVIGGRGDCVHDTPTAFAVLHV